MHRAWRVSSFWYSLYSRVARSGKWKILGSSLQVKWDSMRHLSSYCSVIPSIVGTLERFLDKTWLTKHKRQHLNAPKQREGAYLTTMRILTKKFFSRTKSRIVYSLNFANSFVKNSTTSSNKISRRSFTHRILKTTWEIVPTTLMRPMISLTTLEGHQMPNQRIMKIRMSLIWTKYQVR